MFRTRVLEIFFGFTLFTNLTVFAAADPAESDLLVTENEEEFVKKFEKLVAILRSEIGEDKFNQLAQEALQNIRDGNFTHFDPVVGDTSCELRALLGVIVQQQLEHQADGPTLNTRNLVTLVYILGHAVQTTYSTDGFNTHPKGGENNFKRLTLVLGLSAAKVKNLRNILRRAVAYGSVIFAREQANGLTSNIGTEIVDLFRQCLFDNLTNRQPVVSCLGIAHLTLELAKVHHFPILLRLRLAENANSSSLGYVLVAYMWDEDEGSFVRRNLQDLGPTQAAVVMDAVTGSTFAEHAFSPTGEQIESFLDSLDFAGLFLLEGTLHPQFASGAKNIPLSRERGNRIAQEWETVREQNLVQIVHVDHVYVSTVQTILERTLNRDFIDLRTARYFPTSTEFNVLSIENIIRLCMSITYASMTLNYSGKNI